MATPTSLKNIHFVLDARGKEAAVQMSIKDWQSLLEYLEEMEDRAAMKKMIARLRKGPQKSGALAWQDIKEQW
jgi:PHD/YefM family antitoxin component YafN of YafNO toxin-antitoxin module